MGNRSSTSYIDNCLKFDRILDSENLVYVGIGSLGPGLSSQSIRIGDYTKKYYRLQDFTQEENKLCYRFEDDVSMTLEKNGENILMHIVEFPRNIFGYKIKKVISKPLEPVIVKYFKPIELHDTSTEIDKIHEFFKSLN